MQKKEKKKFCAGTKQMLHIKRKWCRSVEMKLKTIFKCHINFCCYNYQRTYKKHVRKRSVLHIGAPCHMRDWKILICSTNFDQFQFTELTLLQIPWLPIEKGGEKGCRILYGGERMQMKKRKFGLAMQPLVCIYYCHCLGVWGNIQYSNSLRSTYQYVSSLKQIDQ